MDGGFNGGRGVGEVWAWEGVGAGDGGEFSHGALEAAEGVADVEDEAEALGEEEFGGDDGVWVHGEAFGEGAEGDEAVFCFGGEEKTAGHDVARVVDHGGV